MGTILVEVCAGTHCVMMGAMNIIDAVHSLDEVRAGMGNSCEVCEIQVQAVSCMELCRDGDHGPFVRVDGKLIPQAESENVMAAILARCQEHLDSQA